jgi:hypothetical protein
MKGWNYSTDLPQLVSSIAFRLFNGCVDLVSGSEWLMGNGEWLMVNGGMWSGEW